MNKSEESKDEGDKGTDIKKKEINMDPLYWKQKFLFPYIKNQSQKVELTEPKSPVK